MLRQPRALLGAALAALIGLVAAAPASAQTEPALNWDNYEKITLASGANTNGGPLDLALMPDGRIIHTNRNGLLRLTDPKSGVSKTINTFDVYVASEEGLQTVALDPNFAQNKWVYIFYMPRVMTGNHPDGTPYPTTVTGNAPTTLPAGQTDEYWKQWRGYNLLSRFKWNDATNSLDMASEQEIVRIPVQRGQCCHHGTDVAWDSKGNLYLSTGDNTPAGGLGGNGYAPVNDDTPGVNPGMDSRRSSGNTNDLRGKILRIKVLDAPTGVGLGQSYTAPDGNLFAPGTLGTLPEIYIMGLRNPFRIEVDPETDELSWGDYGPDSGSENAQRGPMGKVEWSVTNKPQNAGWPFCVGDHSRVDNPNITGDGPFGHTYSDWDHVALAPKGWWDCSAPVNDSKWNNGLVNLPPAVPPTAYYGDRLTDQPRPEFFTFRSFNVNPFQSPMAGPRYHYDAANTSPTKWPAHWDDKYLFYEFDNRYIAGMQITMGANGVGVLGTMENILPNTELNTAAKRLWHNVIDMEFGKDGSLYTIEYGSGGNTNTALVRTDYSPGNKTPQAKISATPNSNSGAPLTVQFSAAGSVDPEGAALTYEWDFDGNGTFDATGVSASHTYTINGAYTAILRVTDPSGKFALVTTQITVGNQAPTVTINAPVEGGFFSWGDAFVFNVTATDPEDGATPVCTRMARTWSLGHNDHLHGVSTGTGCTGAVATGVDAGHDENEDTYGVLQFDYTDAGSGGVGAATTTKIITLQQRLQQGEFADERVGVTTSEDAAASGGRYIGSFNAGDHLAYSPVNLVNITGVRTHARGDGTLSLRFGAVDAPAFATIAVNSGAWSIVNTTFASVPTGTGKLYVTSNGGAELDALEFVGDGVADKTAPTASAALTPAQPNGSNGWYTSNVTLTITGTDNGAIGTRQYSLNGGQTWTNTNNQGVATINTQGVNSILYRVTDLGGNVSSVGGPLVVRLDSVAPVSTATLNPAAPGPGGYYDGSPQISISATDALSGLAKTEYMVDGGAWQTYTGPFTVGPGTHNVQYRSTDAAGNVEAAKAIPEFKVAAVENGEVGGNVPATLSLSLGGVGGVGGPGSFGAFTPGVARDYTASTTGSVISTAGNAALTVADRLTATGHLVNGAFSLPQPLQVNGSNAASPAGAFAPVGSSANPTALLSWSAPVSNDAVAVGFKQSIGASDALRTGNYSKTLTFTLSTTSP